MSGKQKTTDKVRQKEKVDAIQLIKGGTGGRSAGVFHQGAPCAGKKNANQVSGIHFTSMKNSIYSRL